MSASPPRRHNSAGAFKVWKPYGCLHQIRFENLLWWPGSFLKSVFYIMYIIICTISTNRMFDTPEFAHAVLAQDATFFFAATLRWAASRHV